MIRMRPRHDSVLAPFRTFALAGQPALGEQLALVLLLGVVAGTHVLWRA